MKTVIEKVTIKFTEAEQGRLNHLVDTISDTYLCELVDCSNCLSEICSSGKCPFFDLDEELRQVVHKIKQVVKDCGSEDAD